MKIVYTSVYRVAWLYSCTIYSNCHIIAICYWKFITAWSLLKMRVAFIHSLFALDKRFSVYSGLWRKIIAYAFWGFYDTANIRDSEVDDHMNSMVYRVISIYSSFAGMNKRIPVHCGNRFLYILIMLHYSKRGALLSA